jgi:hypothetical protein
MGLPSVIVWVILMTASLIFIALTAAAEAPARLIATTGIAGLLWALVAVRERRALVAAAASRSRVEGATARYMGLVWAWGALGLFVTYVFILDWREWWQFCMAFAVAGAVCVGYSLLLERDADAERDDETMLALGRTLAIGQLAGMIVTVIGLVLDPDKEFLRLKEGDWAANSIFLSGALALAAITAHALLDAKTPSPPAKV